MPINILCPTCQKELAAPDELAGQVAECPYCQNRFQVNAPNKANAKTVRMPVPAQRGSGHDSASSTNSGAAAAVGVGSKVSMGGPPASSSHAAPAADSSQAKGKHRKSAVDEKAAAAMRETPPSSMPPAGTFPAAVHPMGSTTESAPATAMPAQPPVPPAGPGLGTSGVHPSSSAPPVIAMPPIARQSVGSVSMPLPLTTAVHSARPLPTGPLANAGSPPLPPPAAKRRMNRAVFKTSDTAKSQVHLGADGRLPELHLEEGLITDRPVEEKKQTNPLLLLAVLGISVGMSVLMLFYEGSTAADENRAKAAAREIISDRYMNGNPLEPYQILLREALQAGAQGKSDLERQRYRRVLDMLHSEGKSKMEGLTGLAEPAANNPGAPNDRELERQLSILLAD